MHIAIIGGREKNGVDLHNVARAAGYELELHNGHSTRVPQSIRNIVARAELVVIVTEINSHNGALVAKREAQRYKKPILVTNKFSSARLRGLIDAIELRRQRDLLGEGDNAKKLNGRGALRWTGPDTTQGAA